eukprot:2306260-Amphidinium_carterae.1
MRKHPFQRQLFQGEVYASRGCNKFNTNARAKSEVYAYRGSCEIDTNVHAKLLVCLIHWILVSLLGASNRKLSVSMLSDSEDVRHCRVP